MEKRISELVSGLDASVIELEEFNVVSTDRIKEITMNKIRENKSAAPRHFKAERIVLIAAVLVMTLCVCVCAYAGFAHYDKPDDMLESFFCQESYTKGEHIVEYETIELDGEAYEKLKTNMPAWERMPLDKAVAEKYIYPYVYGVGESISYKDYTLTVEAIVYDANIGSGLLYYTVENPNGVEGYGLAPNGVISWPTDSPYYTAISHAECVYMDAKQTTETKLYLCGYFISIDGWGDFQLRIGNGAEHSRGEYEALTIMLPDESLEVLSIAGGDVLLSPIGMEVDKKTLDLDLDSDIDHIYIRFADGSEYIVEQDDDKGYISNSAYAIGSSDGSSSRYVFNSIVDIGNVVEVQIEDMIFEVE